MEDDARLIESTLRGDPEAFAGLVRKYQQRLFSALVAATGDADEAEELTQEALVQAFSKLGTFRQASAFYTWLYRIAFNSLISHRRKQERVVSLEQSLTPAGRHFPDPRPPAGDRLEHEERRDKLQRALQAISEEHRHILVLREIEGCDYDEMAEILQVAVGTVRSRLHRARDRLREALLALGETFE